MNWLSRLRETRTGARFEPLQHRHAARLATIHAAAFARPWSTDEFEGFMAERAILLDGLFLGRADQPSGFVLTRRVVDEAEILSVALARTARGRGYARNLLARHLAGLAALGTKRVHLEVEEGNEPALALYRRLGFVETGQRPNYYARPDGTRAGALSMTIYL